MVSPEQSSSSFDRPEDAAPKREDESDNGDSNDDVPLEASEQKTIHVHEPEVEPDQENAFLALWGRFDSLDKSEPFVVYLEFDAMNFESSVEKDDEEEEQPQDLDLRENLVAILGSEEKTHLDPSLAWHEFYSRLLNYNVESHSIPEATLEKYREILENYVNETRIQSLNEFVKSEREDEIENWLDALRDEFFPPDLGYYELHLRFVNPDRKIQNEEGGQGEVTESAEPKGESDSTTSVEVSYVTNPSRGVTGSNLSVGQNVYYRIVGEAVEHLPDALVDPESSQRGSVPMVGPITSIEERPDEAESLESSNEDYYKILVEIEPTVTGSDLVFKDDHIKVPGDDNGGSTGKRNFLFFGFMLVLILILIVFLIFSF